MTYAFDPELLPWLEMLPDVRLRDAESLAVAREMRRKMTAETPPYEPQRPLDVWDTTTPDVPVRVYAPAERTGPVPGLLYIHGGGFVNGDVAASDPHTARMADLLGVVVVSVEYRLAPEHPFPAPVEDCYTALEWLTGKAADLGVDPGRIAVMGESAGGGLAAGVTLLARDRGGPALSFQYLGIPELDDRLATESMRDYHDTPSWNRPNAVFSWQAYLGPDPGEVSPYAAPARARDLSGLPPAVVTVCQFDPLRDEGIEYARRLAHAGVPTELRMYPGTFHGSTRVATAAITRRMAADQLADLSRGLGLPTW